MKRESEKTESESEGELIHAYELLQRQINVAFFTILFIIFFF